MEVSAFSASIDTWYTSQNFRNHLIINGAQALGYLLCRQSSLTLVPNQYYLITHTYLLGDMSDINNRLIHTDTTKQGSLLSSDKNRSPVCWCAPETISISYW